MSEIEQPLGGTPSDACPDILATGVSDVHHLFVSLSERHPQGLDAEYLRWHSLDHRPEQQRLQSIRSSLRVVSTPECRKARAISTPAFDAIDHVMTYFFTGLEGLAGFNDLAVALRDAGRSPFILQAVQRGVYEVQQRAAAARAVVGADVLPWLPTRGLYLIIEQGAASVAEVTAIPGVAGAWSALAVASGFSTAALGQRITVCFLDGEPLKVAEQMQPLLQKRWASGQIEPLLAAPFYTLVPYEWGRYVP